VLGAVAAVLLLGVGGLAVSASSALSDQDKKIKTLQAQASNDADADAAVAAASAPVDTAGLQTKYKAVKDADSGVSAAIQKWNTDENTKFGVVLDALEKCYKTVDDYNRAVAPANAAQRGTLPAKVDLSNPQTDCSRTSLRRL
jgi:hypothetical protein